jgi:hypothetical protein
MKIRYLIAFALILILWTFVCEWYHGKFDKKEIKSDTTLFVKWDTIHDTLPEIRYEKKIKYIPVPDSIFITDTITNEKVLPIVQREYTDDSTYTAYVSGVEYDDMPKLDSIMTSLNTLLADPALQQTLHNVEGMTGNLKATSSELRTLSASLNREMPQMMEKTNGVLDNTQQLTANLSTIDVADMMAKVDRTLKNVEEMTQRLNNAEGTLGLLMRDKSLYQNLTRTAADADSLMIDLKQHPKRYVHFSIFGKKDK